MNRALLVLAMAIVSQYGYKLAPAGALEVGGQIVRERSWLYYILQAICAGALAYLLIPSFRTGSKLVCALGVGACTFLVFENAETAICGTVAAGTRLHPIGDGLCSAAIGSWFGPLCGTLIAWVIWRQ